MQGSGPNGGAADAVVRLLVAPLFLASEFVRSLTWAAAVVLRPSHRPVRVLDLRTVMSFFAENRGHPGATAGVLARTSHGRGYTVLLAFLDSDGEPLISGNPRPPSRSYFVYRLADDLVELFGDGDVIVLN